MKQHVMIAIIWAGIGAWSSVQANEEAQKAATLSRAEMLARGQQITGSVCVACHGIDGNSPISSNPSIAGHPEQYIASQLALYKSGARKNAIMQGMAVNLTPEDMKALGVYFYSQTAKPITVARDQAIAERGQKIYRAGIPESKVPACAGCHGGAGAGIPAHYPRLAGQYPEYTLAQLRLYNEGARKHPQMGVIAARMHIADMQAVAEYIAGMRLR